MIFGQPSLCNIPKRALAAGTHMLNKSRSLFADWIKQGIQASRQEEAPSLYRDCTVQNLTSFSWTVHSLQ
jgi:hypothetical protein